MRIVLCGPYPLDDAEQASGDGLMQAVVTLAHALARLPQLEVHVVTRSTRLRVERSEIRGGVHVTWVADPWAKPDYLSARALLRRRFANALERLAPDIVHGHGEAPFIRAALDQRAPSIITLHGIFAQQTRAHGRRIPLPYRVAYALMRRWEDAYIPRIRNLIAINAHIAEYVRCRSPEVEVSSIKNAIDDEFFDVRDTEARPTILVVGQVSPRKGVEVLLEAFERIADAHPDCQVRVVGDCSQHPAYAAALQSRFRALLDADRVVFAGAGTRADVRRELGDCSLLCLPSFYEASSVALMEALAAAKPVVASRVGDADEILGGTGAGVVVEPGNVEQLASALDGLLRDRPGRQDMGRRAREVARERASRDAVARQTVRAYERAIAAHHGRRA